MKKVLKIILKLSLLLGFIAYLIYALVDFNRPKTPLVCTGLDIIIHNIPGHTFVSEDEVRTLLAHHEIYPEGQALQDVNLAQLESVLVASPYIAQALCHKTAQGKVAMQVTPLVPVLHVLNNAGEDFYIDNQGGTMPRGQHTTDLLVMTGRVPRATAGPLYAPLGVLLASDAHWSREIQEIHVRNDGDIEITPRAGHFTIVLGDTSKIADKLHRLSEFYAEGLDKVGWNRYETINLKFDNQVIGVRPSPKK